MTVPNPMAPAPTLALPIVHVHGSTSLRRRVLLVLAVAVPGAAPLVAGAIAPLHGDAVASTLASGSGVHAMWCILVVRSLAPLARWTRHLSATFVSIAWALAAAGAAMERDVVAWEPAGLAVVVGATLIGLWLGWAIGGLRFGVIGPLVPPDAAPALASERSVWSERLVERRNLTGLLVLLGIGLVACTQSLRFIEVTWWILPLTAYALVATLPFAIRVTADHRGLRVRSLLLGIPLVTVPLDRIASATAALIDDTEWGQVGSTADRELTTILHRSGAALIVTRTDGSMVVVTADRPDHGAAVLESLRRRHAHAG